MLRSLLGVLRSLLGVDCIDPFQDAEETRQSRFKKVRQTRDEERLAEVEELHRPRLLLLLLLRRPQAVRGPRRLADGRSRALPLPKIDSSRQLLCLSFRTSWRASGHGG